MRAKSRDQEPLEDTSWRESKRARDRRRKTRDVHKADMRKTKFGFEVSPTTKCGTPLSALEGAVVMSDIATTCRRCLRVNPQNKA